MTGPPQKSGPRTADTVGSQVVEPAISDGSHAAPSVQAGATPSTRQFRILAEILENSERAAALVPWGEHKPCPIIWPQDPAEQSKLVAAHISGGPCDATFCVADKPERTARCNPTTLLARGPDFDGLCRWLVIDLDGPNHGPNGLRSPIRVARCLAERLDNLGLASGALFVTSASGQGVHAWIFPPHPIAISVAYLVLVALCKMTRLVADHDAIDCADPDRAHAFAIGDLRVAVTGLPGCIDLFPRSTRSAGWQVTLPFAGAFSPRGGVLLDPIGVGLPQGDAPVPRFDPDAWESFIAALPPIPTPPPAPQPTRPPERDGPCPYDKLPSYVREFIEGRTPQTQRFKTLYPVACALLKCGYDDHETERMVVAGAVACWSDESSTTAEKQAISAVRNATSRIR